MFCPKCGTQNLDSANFCIACAVPLRTLQPSSHGSTSSAETPVTEPSAISGCVEVQRPRQRLQSLRSEPIIVVIDGKKMGNLLVDGVANYRLEAGTHTIQVRTSLFSMYPWSVQYTFEVHEGMTASFTCGLPVLSSTPWLRPSA